jgi:hypothetical protein
MSKQGFVNIHGKEYKTVALRVQEFREQNKDYSIITEIVKLDDEQCVIKASVINNVGQIISTGHGCEFKQSSQINRTSYVENCETSAIGRALACFGLGGTEFASADEVANAIHQQTIKKSNTVEPPKEPITPMAGALDGFTVDELDSFSRLAEEITFFVNNDDVASAKEVAASLNGDEQKAVWSLLQSHIRSKYKKG